MVDRTVDPDHRRRVLISLTRDGMGLANERRLLGGLARSDHAHLAGLLRRLLTSFGDHAHS